MRVAHFDCFSGISGDMVLGAVIDAGVPVETIRAALDSLGLPITLEVERVKRCGFVATKATITHRTRTITASSRTSRQSSTKGTLTERQRELAKAIFRKLAQAEATAHGMPLERVHFHEVGALDSIADIVGAAVGLDHLSVERFTSTAVPTGTGTVKGAHGLMPVPTPGTVALLKGVPLANREVEVRTDDPHRGRHPHHARHGVHRRSGHDHRPHRHRRRHQGFPGTPQYPAVIRRHGAPARRGKRHRRRTRNEPRRCPG